MTALINSHEVRQALEQLTSRLPFPVMAAVVNCDAAKHDDLTGCEYQHAERFSGRRLGTFLAGRKAAHLALDRWGLSRTAIGMRANGAPIWPEPFCGSIAHVDKLAVAITGYRSHFMGLGVDIEQQRALAGGAVELVCSNGDTRPDDISLLFSAKESGYKCTSRFCDRVLDFTEARATINMTERKFTLQPSGPSKGLFPTVNGIYQSVPGLWLTVSYVLEDGSSAN